jgi:hypothetical protein
MRQHRVRSRFFLPFVRVSRITALLRTAPGSGSTLPTGAVRSAISVFRRMVEVERIDVARDPKVAPRYPTVVERLRNPYGAETVVENHEAGLLYSMSKAGWSSG